MIDGNPFSVLRFAEAFPEMIEEIKTLERHAALSFAAGLQLLPEFAPNAVRIEALTQLMLQFAQGSRKPSSADLDRQLNHWMGQTLLPSLEDPVEDSRIVPMKFRERSIYPRDQWVAFNELGPLAESVS